MSLGFWRHFLVLGFSRLPYSVQTKVGTTLYNLTHHKAVALGFCLVEYKLANEALMFAGILLFGHWFLNGLFGYRLKHQVDFKQSHIWAICLMGKKA